MHPAIALARRVDRTHPGLGQVTAVAVLSLLARRCLLIVGPAGTGKSSVGQALQAAGWPLQGLDQLTAASLDHGHLAKSIQERMLWVDDLGKSSTTYGRVATLALAAELVYSGWVERHAWRSHVSLHDYRGAAIVNVQPALLREILYWPVWQSTLRDKTVRYYHLTRPTRFSPNPPRVDVAPAMLDDCCGGRLPGGKWPDLLRQIGSVQWSEARIEEHMSSYVRAAAYLAGRHVPHAADYRAVARLLAPLALEAYITQSEAPEEAWKLSAPLLVVLSWLQTYGAVTVAHLQRTYRLSESSLQGMLDGMAQEGWLTVEKGVIRPTERTARILQSFYIYRPKGGIRHGISAGGTGKEG